MVSRPHLGVPPAEPFDWATGLGVASYAASAEQRDAILGYLREMRSAVELLPQLDPVADALDVGFDPAWPDGDA